MKTGADRACGWRSSCSIPLWMTDQYVLHILIVTGIFIVAAMSLNLLLGYTGQLSLGHVAFFGIGAYASALVSLGFNVQLAPGFVLALAPKPVWCGMLAAIVVAGCVRLVHRQDLVQGARRVLRDRVDQLRRGDAAGRGELGRADAGADGAEQHPAAHAVAAGRGRARLLEEAGELLAGAERRGRLVRPDPPARPLARRPRDDRAAGERAARDLGRHRRDALPRARHGRAPRRSPARRARSTRTTCASSIPTSSSSSTP